MNISHIDLYTILILGVLMGSLPARWQTACLERASLSCILD